MLSTIPQINGFEIESNLKPTLPLKYKSQEACIVLNQGVCELNVENSETRAVVYENEQYTHEPKSDYNKSMKTVKNVGFVNLPIQIHRKAVGRGFVFNLMITGLPGLGKSTFINALFCSDVYNADYPGPSKRVFSSGTSVDSKTFLLRESDVSLCLTLVDTPGFGQCLDNSYGWKPLVKTIETCYEKYLRSELSVLRRTVGTGAPYQSILPEDSLIHLCLYFVSANGHGLHSLDIETLKQLHNKCRSNYTNPN